MKTSTMRPTRRMQLPLAIPRRRVAHDIWRYRSHRDELSRRFLSTTCAFAAEVETREPIRAAPEIDFNATPSTVQTQHRRITDDVVRKLRVVPRSASYFTAKPQYTDDLLELQQVLRDSQTLPVCKPGEAPRTAWRPLEQYKMSVGDEPIKSSRYAKIEEVLRRLNQIHPAVRTPAVVDAIEKFKREIDPLANRAKPILIDEHGRARGRGKRKTSIAQVWLVEGEGEFMVNGKSLADAFGRVHDRESALWALKVTDRVEKYNAWALVRGGGTTGQAEALTLGLSKALMAHEPSLKPALRKAGCVSHDPRQVERKKHGRVKARKKPTWVKR